MLGLLSSLVLLFVATVSPASAHEVSLTGLVLATLPGQSEIIVRHGALLGAPAATSTFRVVPGSSLKRLHAGMTIAGTADIDTAPWSLSGIRVSGSESVTGAAPADAPAPKVLRDVHHVAIGEYAPTPTFLDQRGRPFSLRDFHGETVVMAFVYTRCRDVRECPLITSRFGVLQTKFRGRPVHLVLITLDPAFDRPAVLAQYGRTFAADPARWSFATGDPDTVLDFAAQFDVTAFPDERVGLIHPERLVVIDKYGSIRELVDEGAWTPGEVVSAVDHDQLLASNPLERLNLWLSAAAVSVCGNGVAGFSGFTDLLTVFAISAFFGYLLWRVGRAIAGGAT